MKVAQFGLGPIGIESVKLAATKPWMNIIGGIDIDPAKIGKSLAELTGVPALANAKVFGSLDGLLAAAGKPDVILHTSVSKIKAACDQIEPMARLGISVVSSCEELLFPSLRDPAAASQLDAVCRQHGARVLGTGVNPGFVMDVLPVCLTGVCRSVSAVHVQRVVNATTRRGPLQKKIGSGLPPAAFEKLFAEGKAGHAGLKESAALIAHCLGWKISSLTETCQAMVADHDITTPHVSVKTGECCGLHQRGEVMSDGKLVISLDLKMYLDAPEPHDSCQIDGEPALKMTISTGVAGDSATVSAVINAAPRILKAPPGLLLMTDIGVPSYA